MGRPSRGVIVSVLASALVAGMLAAPTWGQVTFTAQPSIDTGVGEVYGLAAADLDGDGDLDLATTNADGNTVAWYASNGDGTFGAAQVLTDTAQGALSVVAADLDDDGDVDLAASSWRDDTIQWFPNNGDGTFAAGQVVATTANGVYQIVTGDLDGDGDVDLASASILDNTIAWYANDGAGTFTTQPDVTAGADFAQSLTVADLDGDGDLDLASADAGDDRVAWYANDGDGVFTTQPDVADLDGARPSEVASADLDGDGDIDLVSANTDGTVTWFANGGSGTFTAQPVLDVGFSSPFSVVPGDLDNDGDLDLVVGGQGEHPLTWFAGDGAGGFTAQPALIPEGHVVWITTVADLDDDGDGDVVWADAQDGTLEWHRNDLPPRGGTAWTAEPVGTGGLASATTLAAADLDRDGDLDLVAGDYPADTVAWFANDGAGTYVRQADIATDVSGVAEVDTADLDGDGDVDVVAMGGVGNVLTWYANDGTGSFTPQPDVFTAGGAGHLRALAIGDIDDDGDVDLVLANVSTDTVTWFANDGAGGFTAQPSPDAVDVTSLALGDLDGDGDLDIATASGFDRTLAWLANDGSGTFIASPVIATGDDGADRVATADLDDDGDVDLIATHGNRGTVRWYANDGGGGFAPMLVRDDLVGPGGVGVADLDVDGDLDLVPAAQGAQALTVNANDGAGTFAPQPPIDAVATVAWEVVPVDVDDDGDPDLVVADTSDDGLTVYRNHVPQDPTVDAGGPWTVVDGDSVVLTATASDPDGGGVDLAWDLDDDGDFDDATGGTATFDSTVHGAPGDNTVTVRVTDDEAVTATDAATVTVTVPPPPPGGGGPGGPDQGPAQATDRLVDLELPEDPADNSTLSVQVSQARTPDAPSFAQATGTEVLLASEVVFADALASGALQGDRTLLLNAPDELEPEVLEEIRRLGAGTVRILGGEQAIAPAVADQLVAAGLTVDRTSGATRLETAVAIGRLDGLDTASGFLGRAFAADGASDPTQAFADSLALGGWAAEAGRRIYLTPTEALSDTPSEAIDEDGMGALTIVGGTAAVSDAVADDVEALVDDVGRVSGDTRFASAVAVATARGVTAQSPTANVIVVEGQAANAWAAGFTVAGLSADLPAPVLLANGPDLPEATQEALATAVAEEVGRTVICVAHPDACAAVAVVLGLDV